MDLWNVNYIYMCVCVSQMWDVEMQIFKSEKLKEIDHCRGLGVDRSILLILWISKKQNGSIRWHSICPIYEPVVSFCDYTIKLQVPKKAGKFHDQWVCLCLSRTAEWRHCEHYTFVQRWCGHYMFVLWLSALYVDILIATLLNIQVFWDVMKCHCLKDCSAFKTPKLQTLWHSIISQKTFNLQCSTTQNFHQCNLCITVCHWMDQLMYQCLLIMCSPCLFLYCSVYSKICLFLVYYTVWSGNIPEYRAYPHHGRSLKSHSVYSIYTSCLTRFHSHSLHITSSDDHSLFSHGQMTVQFAYVKRYAK